MIKYNSPLILSYTFVCLLTVVLGMVTRQDSTLLLFAVYKSSWSDPFAYIRIFGYVLGHADFGHYFSNFLVILLLGPMLEEKYGWKLLLGMMLFTALMGGLVHLLFFDNILLGASGIVFMLILLSSFANTERGKIPLTLLLVVVVFIGQEVVSGITLKDNISQLTHIVGGICGAVLGFTVSGRKSSPAVD